VLPPLLEFLNTVICGENHAVNHRGTLTKLFYAIEKFSEGLGIVLLEILSAQLV